MTKAQLKEKFEQYKTSITVNLWDAYGTYSSRKRNIYDAWYCKMMDRHGYGMRIISYNSQFFTLGFLRNILDDTDCTIHTIFTFVTPMHVYELDVTELI